LGIERITRESKIREDRLLGQEKNNFIQIISWTKKRFEFLKSYRNDKFLFIVLAGIPSERGCGSGFHEIVHEAGNVGFLVHGLSA
jgi:hypothetical protein